MLTRPSQPSAEVLASCHLCQIRSFATHVKAPITIVNTVEGSNAVIPSDFRFIDHSILGKGVTKAPEDFGTGCQCTDDKQCEYGGCLCFQELEQPDHDVRMNDAGSDDGSGSGATQTKERKMISYHTSGEKKGILRRRVLKSRNPIYECHSRCACSEDCPNRVTSKGRQVPLEIFRTTNRGWGKTKPISCCPAGPAGCKTELTLSIGVQSSVPIKQGQFVDLYLGEIITSKEATARRAKADIAQRKDIYLFELDKFSNPESEDHRLREDPYVVDGEFASGPTRFINHSCNPNLRIFGQVEDHADKPIHGLAFFALEDIEAGTELTFDYRDGSEEETDDSIRDPEKRKKMTKCLCGEEECRGYLW